MVELDHQIAAVWKTIFEGDGEWLADRIMAFDFSAETVETELEKGIDQIIDSMALENVHSVNLLKNLGFQIENNLELIPFNSLWVNLPSIISILDNPCD